MKKFWLFIGIALLLGLFVGERARLLLLDGLAFFWSEAPAPISLSAFSSESPSDIPVIGKRLDGFVSILLAAAGENAGIQKGDRVITHEDEYVGRVANVSSSVSQIILASRPGEHFAGWLPVLSAPLELEGHGAGLLRASVPTSFLIQEGDEVWFDARLDAFIGYVATVRDFPDLKKEVFIRQTINPLMLSSVRIIP